MRRSSSPYSPDCTPIERAFSKIKAIPPGLDARTREALLEVVRLAADAITRDDAAAWFAHAGYPLPNEQPCQSLQETQLGGLTTISYDIIIVMDT